MFLWCHVGKNLQYVYINILFTKEIMWQAKAVYQTAPWPGWHDLQNYVTYFILNSSSATIIIAQSLGPPISLILDSSMAQRGSTLQESACLLQPHLYLVVYPTRGPRLQVASNLTLGPVLFLKLVCLHLLLLSSQIFDLWRVWFQILCMYICCTMNTGIQHMLNGQIYEMS